VCWSAFAYKGGCGFPRDGGNHLQDSLGGEMRSHQVRLSKEDLGDQEQFGG